MMQASLSLSLSLSLKHTHGTKVIARRGDNSASTRLPMTLRHVWNVKEMYFIWQFGSALFNYANNLGVLLTASVNLRDEIQIRH